jgi:CO/xanthine dehydrogenase Mo-binding subunit
VSGLNAEQIYIHNCFIGGGFGRKSANDEMVQAIAIAKAVQRPVKLIWTREEDMRRDRFRPQAVTRFKAGLDTNGMPVAWSMRNVIGSIFASLGMHRPGLKGPEPMAVAGLANNAYNVPNTRVDAVLKNTHLPVMFWRAPAENQNIFALESFVDEIAAASGQDPYQFRRKLLEGKPDWLKVLDTVAEKSDWGKPLPKGKGRGIAICDEAGSRSQARFLPGLGLSPLAGAHHVDIPAAASRAHQPGAPRKNRRLGTIPAHLLGRIGFAMVAACFAPHDQSDVCRSGVAQGHWRTRIGIHRHCRGGPLNKSPLPSAWV